MFRPLGRHQGSKQPLVSTANQRQSHDPENNNTGQLVGLLIYSVCNGDVKEDRNGAKLPACLHFPRERSEREPI